MISFELKKSPDFLLKSQLHMRKHLDGINGTAYCTGSKFTVSKFSYIQKKERKVVKNKIGVEEEFVELERGEITLSNHSVRLSSDALVFLLCVEGLQKNLILFLLFYQMKKIDQTFRWNNKVIDEFLVFCKNFYLKEPTVNSVKEAMKKLSQKKMVSSIRKGFYQLNPILTYETKREVKQKQLGLFSENSLLKKRIVEDELFPLPISFL